MKNPKISIRKAKQRKVLFATLTPFLFLIPFLGIFVFQRGKAWTMDQILLELLWGAFFILPSLAVIFWGSTIKYLNQIKLIDAYVKYIFAYWFFSMVRVLWFVIFGNDYWSMAFLLGLFLILTIPLMAQSYKKTFRLMQDLYDQKEVPGLKNREWTCNEVVTGEILETIAPVQKNFFQKYGMAFLAVLLGGGLFWVKIPVISLGTEIIYMLVTSLFIWQIASSLVELIEEIAILNAIRTWERERGKPVVLV